MDEDEAYLYEDDEQQQVQDDLDDLDECQKKGIREVYDRFDLDGNGSLSFKELREGLQILGLNPTVKEVREIAKKYRLEKRKIGYEEFEEIMKEKLLSKTDKEFDLFTAFSIFDKNKDGFIDKEELSTCLKCMGERLSDDDVNELFSCLDEDNNGRLSVMVRYGCSTTLCIHEEIDLSKMIIQNSKSTCL